MWGKSIEPKYDMVSVLSRRHNHYIGNYSKSDGMYLTATCVKLDIRATDSLRAKHSASFKEGSGTA